FYPDFSDLSGELGDAAKALDLNSRGIELIDDLSRSAPVLAIQHADAHNVRGHLLQVQRSPDALAEYRESLRLLQDVAATIDPGTVGDFHQRFAELLLHLASMRQERPADKAAR